MITTVADLLDALVEREKLVLAKQPELNHGPMLGDMFEGLTRSLAEKAVFKGLDLRVVEGKIKDSDGNLSNHMDCMIVEGNGHRLPYTDHHIYPFEKVIAVIESKKTLHGTKLSDSFFHLRELKDDKTGPQKHAYGLLRDAWRSLLCRNLPEREELKKLPGAAQAYYCVLLKEVYRPLRIVLGYFGYKSELQLRKGLLHFLERQLAPINAPQRIEGFGINSFPNQIICGKASLIKLDGMPFSTMLPDDGWWPFYASRSKSPIHIFLELLWTRLAYRYALDPEIFGEDLTCEGVNFLLEAKWLEQGWGYRVVEATQQELNTCKDSAEWEPATLTLAEFVLIGELCRDHEVRLDDNEIVQYLAEHGTTPEAIRASLSEKRLAYEQDGRLHLLTDQCACFVLSDGRYVAGENKSGRLLRWVERFTKLHGCAA